MQHEPAKGNTTDALGNPLCRTQQRVRRKRRPWFLSGRCGSACPASAENGTGHDVRRLRFVMLRPHVQSCFKINQPCFLGKTTMTNAPVQSVSAETVDLDPRLFGVSGLTPQQALAQFESLPPGKMLAIKGNNLKSLRVRFAQTYPGQYKSVVRGSTLFVTRL